jgi:hypothetical protein
VRSITELEGYAVSKRVAPSVELGTAIERLLGEGVRVGRQAAGIGRLGARLTRPKAIEEEVEAFLGRGR